MADNNIDTYLGTYYLILVYLVIDFLLTAVDSCKLLQNNKDIYFAIRFMKYIHDYYTYYPCIHSMER